MIREEAERFGQEHHVPGVLKSLTTFVGGGGPRFWFSVDPERQQLNYAQIIVEVTDKHITNEFVGPMQTALSREVPGARIDVRQLETGKPVGIPISIRISGADTTVLHRLSGELQAVFRAMPTATRVRDDWDQPTLTVRLKVDPDRANLSGVTNLDVALSSTAALSGLPVSTYRELDKQIPIAVRLRMEDRAALSDVQNTYVYSMNSNQRVPLGQVSHVATEMTIPKIKRRNQFRTVTVSAFPIPGILPSQVLTPLLPQIETFKAALPPGYFLEIGGEYDEQVSGFQELAVVMAVSVALIYLALVLQFGNAIKPLLVFAAIPYGMSGAFVALAVMGQPFGFMAFLGRGQPRRRHRQPRHRAVRLHRRSASPRRAAARGAAGCRHRATAAGDDHGRRDRARTGAARDARRPAVGAAVLRADRRADPRDVHHAAARAGAVCDLRPRSQVDQMGGRVALARACGLGLLKGSRVMRIATLTTTAGLTLLLATLALAQSVSVDYDRAASFSSYLTYAWTRGTQLTDELNHARVVRAIDGRLAAKGLRQVEPDADPDILVAYHASFDTNLRIDAFSTGWGPYGLGNRSGSAWIQEILVGTLVVDIADARRHTLVWRGTATSNIHETDKPEKRDRNIAKATEKMFKNYPPKP